MASRSVEGAFLGDVGRIRYVVGAVWPLLAALDVALCALLVRADALPVGSAMVSGAVAAAMGGLAAYALGQRRIARGMMTLIRQRDQAAGEVASALRVERDLAAQSSASKTRFFAAASHDLRQPLHALSINATTLQLVAGRQDDPVIRDLSVSITRALQRSNGLLDSLLDLSRLDAGAVQLKLEPVNVLVMLRAMEDQFQAGAEQRGLALVIDVAGGIDPSTCMLADVVLMFRVLGNLLSNAIKFTSSGEVRVSAAIEEMPPDGTPSPVSISVSDTGRGIGASELKRVFEEFYQVGNPQKDADGGLGLGLSIVRRAAELMNVEIGIESVVGQGTVVSLVVPGVVSDLTRNLQSAFAASDRHPLQTSQGSSPIRALLVEDEPQICDSLKNFMPYLGYELRSAGNSREALALVASGFVPTVLVIDQLLREETGLLVVHRLWRVLGRVPAVMVTGDTDPATVELAQASGMRVVHKPIDGVRLIDILREVQEAGQPEGVAPTA